MRFIGQNGGSFRGAAGDDRRFLRVVPDSVILADCAGKIPMVLVSGAVSALPGRDGGDGGGVAAVFSADDSERSADSREHGDFGGDRGDIRRSGQSVEYIVAESCGFFQRRNREFAELQMVFCGGAGAAAVFRDIDPFAA